MRQSKTHWKLAESRADKRAETLVRQGLLEKSAVPPAAACLHSLSSHGVDIQSLTRHVPRSGFSDYSIIGHSAVPPHLRALPAVRENISSLVRLMRQGTLSTLRAMEQEDHEDHPSYMRLRDAMLARLQTPSVTPQMISQIREDFPDFLVLFGVTPAQVRERNDWGAFSPNQIERIAQWLAAKKVEAEASSTP